MKEKIIKIPRSIADGVLQTNHFLDQNTRIAAMPNVEGQEKNIELVEIATSHKEFCKTDPLLWDVVLNCLDLAIAQKAFEDAGKHHYEIIVPLRFFDSYLNPIEDKHMRYRTRKKISDSFFMRPPMILYRASDGRMERGFPVIASLVDENNKDTTDNTIAKGITDIEQILPGINTTF